MAKDRLGGTTLKVGGFLEEFEKDKIKDSVDIVTLFEEFGIKLEKKGSNYMGCCPWHEDNTPSLSVDKTKGLYNCFGCGESGDIFNLVMKMKNLDFKQASLYLKGDLNSTQKVVKPIEQPKKLDIELVQYTVMVKPLNHSLNGEQLLERVKDYYFSQIQSNSKALSYLESRGLKDNSLIKHYEIGFSNGSLKSVLSEKQIEELKYLGILTEQGNETLLNHLIFPLKNSKNQVVGFYGRTINSSSKIKHKYLKGGHKGLLDRMVLEIYKDDMILTESVLDTISLKKLGFNNVIPVTVLMAFQNLT